MNMLRFVYILLLSIVEFVLSADPTITISDGTIKGRVLLTNNLKQKYFGFQSIPYATPPLKQLRFKPPIAPKKWDGVLDGTKESHECYQVKNDSPAESEDCLYVNVFTPVIQRNSTEKLPVMFFIYGGAFRGGSSGFSTYGPDYFIEQGIIVVTHNYRVGPFGFLSTGDMILPGNAGLKDQAFALKWTAENIERFGGDPSQITIFGQSAGSASVGYQLLSKLSSGLFRAAIQESGSPLNEWAFIKNPKAYALELADTVSQGRYHDVSSEGLLEYLQNATAYDIDQASKNTPIRLTLPTIEPDHEGAFLTQPMYELFASGNFNRVPLIIGINSEEELVMATSHGALKVLGRKYDSNPADLIPVYLEPVNGTNQTAVGQLIKTIYVGKENNLADNLGPLIRWYSDNGFTRGIIKQAELCSKYVDVFFYQFSYDGKLGGFDQLMEGCETVIHGEELRYIFVRRGKIDTTDLSIYPEADILTHKRIMQLWTNFAKHMHPTPVKDKLLQNIIWPVVDKESYHYLNINSSLEVQKEPKATYYKKWDAVFSKYGVEPYMTY